MESTPIRPGNSDSAALTQPDFGMLRACVGARQQALRTVRVLAESNKRPTRENSDPMTANLAILSGHGSAAPTSGRFSYHYADGAPCHLQGEDHV